jgi:hypothetical protein
MAPANVPQMFELCKRPPIGGFRAATSGPSCQRGDKMRLTTILCVLGVAVTVAMMVAAAPG